jgi:hypothetical protein
MNFATNNILPPLGREAADPINLIIERKCREGNWPKDRYFISHRA